MVRLDVRIIDVLGDVTNDHMADRAIVCLDGKETSKMADESDWCYVATRGSKNGHTLMAVLHPIKPLILTYKRIILIFIAIGGTSGENDRYVKTPHAAYEFKIPIEQIGFEDEYRFFMQVFDGDDVMTYPNEHSGKYQKIPSPKQWGGVMISPDHSISSEHFNQN